MNRTKHTALALLLALCFTLGLLPALTPTASAATLDSSSATWSEDSTISEDVTINESVAVTADITLTIPAGLTLTVNGGILIASGTTLTVAGAGTLTVTGSTGSTGSTGATSEEGGTGGDGGVGVSGNITVDGGNVTISGGTGGTGGTGGEGEEFGGTGGTGGTGGAGVNGNVTVNGGNVTISGGNGGTGGTGGPGGDGSGSGGNSGSVGQAVTGTITYASGATAQESDNNSTWSDLSGSTSAKRYVKITPPNPVEVSYLYYASEADAIAGTTASGTATATPVTASDTAWGSADSTTWYVVDSTFENTNRVTVTGDVRLILADGFTLTASKGISVTGDGNSLTIYAQSAGDNMGGLSATATDFGYAGIGGGQNAAGSEITINGGAVTANSNNYGAGIGGGSGGAGGKITINGGTVTANGGTSGTGIGGGSGGTGGEITISGGTVTATGGSMGAGIGGGGNAAGGKITINGGTVTAIGGNMAPGIGGGQNAAGEEITISGGTVTATAGQFAAGIGGGHGSVGGAIAISGGSVTSTGGGGGAGIGCGQFASGGTIDITGGIVTAFAVANGSYQGEAIGDGASPNPDSSSTTVTIGAGLSVKAGDDAASATVVANFASNRAYKYARVMSPVSYQNATVNADNSVTFSDATCNDYTPVTASDTSWGAADTETWYVVNSTLTIASRITVTGDVRLILADGCTLTASKGIGVLDGNSLTIYGQSGGTGALTATGGDYNAGIGSGNGNESGNGAGGTITVNGGAVTANGGYDGAGIGGGASGAGGTIIINGGEVTATGGESGAGIGGGASGAGGTIIINSGAVTANGGKYSAGIGGGCADASGAISITGGTVNANGNVGGGGGDGGAGIGGGEDGNNSGSGNSISITGGTVTATVPNGTKGAAIGNGGGSSGTNVTSVTIGAGAVVEAGSSSSSLDNEATAETVKNNKDYKYVKITMPAAPTTVEASYLYYASEADAIAGTTASGTATATPVTASDTAWGSADSTTWYVVNSTFENTNRVTVTGDVHLILADGFTLTASKGINVLDGNSLTIYGQSSGTGALLINAVNDYLAGIGGDNGHSGGTITINGGDITVTGGRQGAGIGGGDGSGSGSVSGDGGAIVINGGKVTATGGASGAGIGGGCYGAGGTITINGGTVTATGVNYSAGIGGGTRGAGGTITINGGTVTATVIGEGYGAGIGGGNNGAGGEIAISGGTVTATGGTQGAGIGGGNGGAGGTITISGGTVKATGGGAGIGGGAGGAGGEIAISGGTVTATGGTQGAGIGGGASGSGGAITISGGDVTATGGANSFDEATSAQYASFGLIYTEIGGGAGIGGGGGSNFTYNEAAQSVPRGAAGTIAISGGTVTANGAEVGIGFGGGPAPAEGTDEGSVSLSWTDADNDSITASSYGGTVTFAKDFVIDGETTILTAGTISTANGKKIVPYIIPVSYQAPTVGADNSVTFSDATCNDYTSVTASDTEWSGTTDNPGWYVVDSNVTNSNRITVTGDVRLILVDYCTLTATNMGITVNEGNSLTIYGQADRRGTLFAHGNETDAGIGGDGQSGGAITINGGAVSAIGGSNAAGIGGGYGGDGGTITVNGGTVVATGENGAAGIGGGSTGGGGTITIRGGDVEAQGGNNGAGIGGGYSAAGGEIAISGGMVKATGGNNGAGIGGGDGNDGGGSGGTIAISGGEVEATGGGSGAGIGGGSGGDGGTIAISGGTVTAQSDGYIGIGGDPMGGMGGTISLSWTNEDNDSITASSYGGSVTLGKAFTFDGQTAVLTSADFEMNEDTGYTANANGKKIVPYVALEQVTYRTYNARTRKYTTHTISEYTLVKANMSTTWSEGVYVAKETVTIANRITVSGTVRLILLDGCVFNAQSGVEVPKGATFNIYDGKLADTAGLASLMSGRGFSRLAAPFVSLFAANDEDGDADDGTVQGTGTLNATGGAMNGMGQSGIGGGGSVTIDGGNVNATGGSAEDDDGNKVGGAGIGGNADDDDRTPGDVTINGGNVNATGGADGGAGIGGDYNGDGGNVTINDGNVTATGASGAAGIGGGDGGDGGEADDEGNGGVTINGGTVNATGGDGGAGIGGGRAYEDPDNESSYIGGDGGDVNLNGGTVNATGGNGGMDIGSGQSGQNAGTMKLRGALFSNPSGSWPPAYTVELSDGSTGSDKKYRYGEDITITVTVSGANFEGGEFTLTYDKNMFQLTNESVAPDKGDNDATNTKSNKFNADSDGKYAFSLNNRLSFASGDALVRLTFKVTGKVTAETAFDFDFDAENPPEICYNTDKDCVAATATKGSVTLEPILYDATLTPDPSGLTLTLTGDNGSETTDNAKAISGFPYTVQIGDYSAVDNEYDVTLTIGGTSATAPTPDTNGVLTIEGKDITGAIVLTVKRTTKHVTPTLEGVTGSNDAIKGVDYTATISGYDTANYTYAVSLTMNGASANDKATMSGSAITIAGGDITGDFTLSVTKTLANFTATVSESDYVTGWALILVAKDSSRTDNPVYCYEGNPMYYVEAYNAYAYLVEVPSGTSAPTADAAKAKVSLGTTAAATIAASEQYDVNHTGKVDYSDTLLTYRCYVKAHQTPATAMENYLRADVNNDKKVDTTDVSAIDSHRATASGS